MSSDLGTNDYWAGAVKTCKDMGSSLPSDTELMKFAEELYQDASGTSFSGNRDNDLAFEMGFLSSASTSSFLLWSSEEYNEDIAYARYFTSTSTYRNLNGRRHSDCQAVCLGD